MKTPSSNGRPPGGRSPAGQDRPRGRPGDAGKSWSDKPRQDKAARAPTAPTSQRQPRLNAPATHTPYAPKPAARPARPEAARQGGPAPAPAGTIWLYGLHPIAAALANPSRRLRRLLLTEEAEAALSAMVTTSFSVAPERTERARLDHLLGRDAVHQGAALLADPLPQPALASVLERPGPVLVLDQVTDPRNVGAILRSAAAFGAACVIAQDRHAPEETGALAKAASGALESMPLIRAVNLARTLVALKAAGLWTVGLAADQPALRGEALRERRIALVLGAEGAGMRRLTRETCDELAGLAMPGVAKGGVAKGGVAQGGVAKGGVAKGGVAKGGGLESLNVSAAATVALYELTRA